MTGNATRASLLIQLRNPRDTQAWAEFVSIYMPLLHAYALKAGLQDSDAADLAQDTVRQVIRNIERFEYAKERGSFRGWLLTIARNLIRKRAKQVANHAVGSGDTEHNQLLQEHPSREETDRWEAEYRRRLFEIAAERVRPEFRPATWTSFWRTAVEGADAASVAEDLKISVGAVYIARSRVMGRLREEVAKLDTA